jgi:hypothetical protein
MQHKLTFEQVRSIMRPLVFDAVGRICHRTEREPAFVREALWPALTATAQLALESGGHQRGRGLLRGDEQKLQAIMSKLEAASPGWDARASGILADRISNLVIRAFPKRVDVAL